MGITELLAEYTRLETELNGLLADNGSYVNEYKKYGESRLYPSLNTPTGKYKYNDAVADITGVSIEECMKYVSSTSNAETEVGVVSSGTKYLCLKGTSVDKNSPDTYSTIVWDMNATEGYNKSGNRIKFVYAGGYYKITLTEDTSYSLVAAGIPSFCKNNAMKGFGGSYEYEEKVYNNGTLISSSIGINTISDTEINKQDTTLHNIFGGCINKTECQLPTNIQGTVSGYYQCGNETAKWQYNGTAYTNTSTSVNLSNTVTLDKCKLLENRCKTATLKLDDATGKPFVLLENVQYQFADVNYVSTSVSPIVNTSWKDTIPHELMLDGTATSISSPNGKWLMSVDSKGELNISCTVDEPKKIEVYPIPGWIKTRYSVMGKDQEIMGKINQLYGVVANLIKERDEQNAEYIHNKVAIDAAIDKYNPAENTAGGKRLSLDVLEKDTKDVARLYGYLYMFAGVISLAALISIIQLRMRR